MACVACKKLIDPSNRMRLGIWCDLCLSDATRWVDLGFSQTYVIKLYEDAQRNDYFRMITSNICTIEEFFESNTNKTSESDLTFCLFAQYARRKNRFDLVLYALERKIVKVRKMLFHTIGFFGTLEEFQGMFFFANMELQQMIDMSREFQYIELNNEYESNDSLEKIKSKHKYILNRICFDQIMKQQEIQMELNKRTARTILSTVLPIELSNKIIRYI
jgi:hypothetical protein